MRRRASELLSLVIALATLSACAAVSVETDYDPEADFAALQTYLWMEPWPTGDPRLDNDLLRQRVRRAVDEQLVAKGFRQLLGQQAEPDFHVIEHYLIEQRVDVDTIVRPYGYYGYRRLPIEETYAHQYELGSVILDVVDARSSRLLWRGTAQARVHENVTPEERTERIRSVVEKILADFPPGSDR